MTPVVVAWCVQLAWEIARSALGADAMSKQAGVLSFAIMLATTCVAAVGFAAVVRQTRGRQRTGLLLACGAYVAMAAALLVRDAAWQAQADCALPIMRALAFGGWFALDAIAIVGLIVAAGGRSLWVTPLALGLCYLGGPASTILVVPALVVQLVFRALTIGILILLADKVARTLPVRRPDPERGLRGVVLLERVSWFFAVLTIPSLLEGTGFGIGTSLTLAIANIVGDGFSIVALAWVAAARTEGLPRWPLYASIACTLASGLRRTHNWVLTLAHHWGSLDSVPLKPAHWAYSVPIAVAIVSSLVAFNTYARRTRSRRIEIATAACAACLVAWFLFLGDDADRIARVTALLGVNIASAVLYRMLRLAFPPAVPAARIVTASAAD